MVIHLIDGTYELFRHFYGLRRFHKTDPPLGAVAGVLGMIVKMIEDGATHLGVATDHIIESFRNELWPGYKTGAGIEPALWRQFHHPTGKCPFEWQFHSVEKFTLVVHEVQANVIAFERADKVRVG